MARHNAPGIRKSTGDNTGVSVVIPCYRQAHFLADAIESVLTQTHHAAEIVVIDDGSPDNASEVAARYSQVRCIRQTNTGLARARERGLRETSGQYLVFLDADDRLLPDALDVAVRALESHPDCAFVWGFNRPIDTEGRILGELSNPFDGQPSYERLLERNIVGPPVGVMFRRAPLLEIGGLTGFPDACEDYGTYLRLARNHCFYCHGELIAEYRYHDAKMSADAGRMLTATLQILDEEKNRAGTERRFRTALAKGRKHTLNVYKVAPRVEQLVADVRAGRWLKALAGAAHLLLTHPVLSFRFIRKRLRARWALRKSPPQ